jgi:hypothetical protein
MEIGCQGVRRWKKLGYPWPRGTSSQCLLNMRLGGSKSRSGLFFLEKEITFHSFRDSNTRLSSP